MQPTLLLYAPSGNHDVVGGTDVLQQRCQLNLMWLHSCAGGRPSGRSHSSAGPVPPGFCFGDGALVLPDLQVADCGADVDAPISPALHMHCCAELAPLSADLCPASGRREKPDAGGAPTLELAGANRAACS
jgi:hypothetical protein